MNNNTLAAKDILLAIPYLPKVALSLLGQGQGYDPLLLEILKYNPFIEEDQHFPSSKELQAQLRLSPTKLRTMLERIYNDFLSSIDGPDTTLIIGSTLVEFYVRFFDKRANFCARLDHIPKVGDEMELSFLRPIFNLYHFYVQSINHHLENDKHSITIWLKAGTFNLYEHLELDHAKSEGRYDWKTDRITEPAYQPIVPAPTSNRYRGWR
jgi:hypothetical protein